VGSPESSKTEAYGGPRKDRFIPWGLPPTLNAGTGDLQSEKAPTRKYRPTSNEGGKGVFPLVRAAATRDKDRLREQTRGEEKNKKIR